MLPGATYYTTMTVSALRATTAFSRLVPEATAARQVVLLTLKVTAVGVMTFLIISFIIPHSPGGAMHQFQLLFPQL